MQIPECYEDVGPGWRKILQDLHVSLLSLKPDYSVAQVKEKFGGLRVYLNEYGQDSEELITQAERLAEKTCESCGTMEDVTTSSHMRGTWIKTLCGACRVPRSLRAE